MRKVRIVAGALAVALFMAAGVGPRAVAAQAASTKNNAPAGVVNLNVATAAKLESLPGVGPAMASRIVDYRQKNGPFKKIEDLMNLKGIGEKSFLKLKPLITVAQTAKAADR